MPSLLVMMGAITFTNWAMLAISTTPQLRFSMFMNAATHSASVRSYTSSSLVLLQSRVRYHTFHSSKAMRMGRRMSCRRRTSPMSWPSVLTYSSSLAGQATSE